MRELDSSFHPMRSDTVQPLREAISNTAREAPAGRPQAASTLLSIWKCREPIPNFIHLSCQRFDPTTVINHAIRDFKSILTTRLASHTTSRIFFVHASKLHQSRDCNFRVNVNKDNDKLNDIYSTHSH